MKLSVYTEVKNRGWEAVAFDLTDVSDGLTAESFTLTAYMGDKSADRKIRALTKIKNGYHLAIDPIYYNGNFRLEVTLDGISYPLTKGDVPLENSCKGSG